ncbi:unnamed protein product [Leptosia nina]|uniref:Mediator of RNA polymerase II transcription subunit 16 n=1 Tax=Leptosia nina TaxID=320188 RepID=A0AAV1JKK3_9NEOP
MDLIYSMRRKPLKCEPPNFDGTTDPEAVRPICTISTLNIIAFTSFTDLSDADGDTWGGHVYVCDLNTPWNSHKVTSTTHPVSTLEWDGEGENLLVGTTTGDVSVYGPKDYLLNDWTCLYTTNLPGEKVIKAIFFHNGRRILALDKKIEVPIHERFQILRSTPTLKGFGGVGCEGACVVTATGLLGALTPASAPGPAQVGTEPLRPARDLITAAAFAHKNGNIVIAASSVCASRRVIRAALVSVSRPLALAPVSLHVTPLPTLYLPDEAVHMPVSISWNCSDDMDSLLIAGNTLSMWKLTERAYPLHKLLYKGPVQGSTTPGGGAKASADCFSTLSWQPTGAWPMESGELGTCIASCKLQLNSPLAVLATPRAVHLLGDSHHYLCSRPVVTGTEVCAPSSTPPKKTKYGPGALPSGAACARVWSVDVSWSSSVAVALDTHSQLHLYKIHADLPSQHAVVQLNGLVEYSMVSGHDCLDALLTLKPNVLEALYERITENFLRQPQAFQQHYYHSWLRLRMLLCSMIPTAAASTSNLTSLLMCSATVAACAGALRCDDKDTGAPGSALANSTLQALQALLDDSSGEHDKNLIALEAKAEAIGETALPPLHPLQALRRPLQRALHTALTTLAALQASASHHGYDLWSDVSAVTLLRKLVVVCRASARSIGCAVDSGAALQSALARLGVSQHAIKPDLIEEWLTLCAQIPGRVWESLPRCGVIAPHGRPPPFYFEYDVEPEALRHVPEAPSYAVSESSASFDMDAVRYMYFGGGEKGCGKWRQCSRCGARVLPASNCARHPLQRAYDARFVAKCRCGGKWMLLSKV